MPGRILNFSEFFDKYSKDGAQGDQGLDALTNAASNFEEGFDSDTYDQNQIGPNRPIAGGSEATPPQPGQVGAPKFTSAQDDSMNAPDEFEDSEEISEEPIDSEESAEQPEEEPAEDESSDEEAEEEEAEESEENEESDDTPEPEAEEDNKNDKDMKESKSTRVKGFADFVNENYMHSSMGMNPFAEEGEEHYDDMDGHFEEESDLCPGCGMPEDKCQCDYHEEGMDVCDNCGEPVIDFGAGPECGCNM